MQHYFYKVFITLLLSIIITPIYANEVSKAAQPFIGTWQLVSVTRETIPAGNTRESFGAHPHGYLNYSPEGRVMVIIVQDQRPLPTGTTVTSAEAETLFKTMTSYAGTYTVLNNQIIHHVDVSWNQKWTGTDQVRHFKFEGKNRLILSLLPVYDRQSGKRVVDHLTWQKIAPAAAIK